jgi:hypothetical protein
MFRHEFFDLLPVNTSYLRHLHEKDECPHKLLVTSGGQQHTDIADALTHRTDTSFVLTIPGSGWNAPSLQKITEPLLNQIPRQYGDSTDELFVYIPFR